LKDLFGADVPDPPPMDAPLPFAVVEFSRGDCSITEYWLARTPEEALATYEGTVGKGDFNLENVRELRPQEMLTLRTFHADFNVAAKAGITFAQALQEVQGAQRSACCFQWNYP
jgi:hypothetical protein